MPSGLFMLQGAKILKFDDGKALSMFALHRPLANACDKDFAEVAPPAYFLRVSRGTVILTFLFLHLHHFNAPRNTSLHWLATFGRRPSSS
jgi:hypothetical protein